jgi:integrase
MPRSLDRALELSVEEAGLPRLSSHGLRHTAATHMVRNARDVGEHRAIADILGHSADMLMRVYAHAVPETSKSIAVRIGQRTAHRTAGGPAGG